MLFCGAAIRTLVGVLRSVSFGAGPCMRPDPAAAAMAEWAVRASMAELSSNSMSGTSAIRSSWDSESSDEPSELDVGAPGLDCEAISSTH